ncbi:MAG: efflux RND transporter periplasmic adaptor subunit [Hellea sp.]
MRPLPKRKSQKPVGVSSEPKVVDIPSKMDQAVAPSRRYGRSIALGLIAVLLLGGAGIAYKTIGLNNSQSVVAERVTTGTASFNSFSETIPVNATLIPENTVFLDTVEGGRVMNLHVEDGEAVTAGMPLVTLKNSDLELQVIGREAQYTQQLSNVAQSQMAFDQSQLRYDRELMDAQLQIDLTRASLQRRLPIEQTGVSQSEIDRLQAELNHQEATYALVEKAKLRDTQNANRNLNQLKQSVKRMEDSVDIIRGSLDQLTLRAPIDGRVSALTLQLGQVLSPGSRVGQVDVAGSFKVRAYVNEFYLNRLAKGQLASASLAGQDYDLSVTKIYPTIANRQFEVDLLFKGTLPENLRRGQNIRVRILMGDAEQALTIPTGPYEATTGGQWVFVLSADGKTAARREIEVGRKSPDRLEVLSGLTSDEKIITSSYDAYGDSQRISLSN